MGKGNFSDLVLPLGEELAKAIGDALVKMEVTSASIRGILCVE